MNDEVFLRIKAIAEKLRNEYNAQKVILFDSYASGKIREESDIDLFIVAPTNEKFIDRMVKVKGIVRTLHKGLLFSPIVLTSEEVNKRMKIGDQFIQEILEKGIEI